MKYLTINLKSIKTATSYSKVDLIIIAVLICVSIAAVTLPIGVLINFAHDDSFFYLKTADNFAQGFGTTFDRINTTNGYHPLWLFLVAGIFYVIRLFGKITPEELFRWVFVIHFFLCSIITMIVSRILEAIYSKSFISYMLWFFICLNMTFVFIRDVGMENVLICLLISSYLLLKAKEISGIAYPISKSVILVMLFLSRIDFLFTIIPSIILSDTLVSPPSVKKKNFAIPIIMVSLSALFYFTFNYILFGSPLTVSAVIKSSFPRILFFQNIDGFNSPAVFFNQFSKLAILIFIILLFPLFNRLIPKDKNLRSFDYFVFGLSLGTLAFCLFNLAFNFEGLTQWYLTIPIFISGFLLFSFINHYRSMYPYVLALLLIALASVFFLTRVKHLKWESTYIFSKKLNEFTDPSDKILQIDGSGIVGFFSERIVINGDGLINSFEYLNVLKSHRLGVYLKKREVKYYATYSATPSPNDSNYFVDAKYRNEINDVPYPPITNAYHFRFPKENLVFRLPFNFDHAVQKIDGEWMLFRIP